nr:ribonuclease H-like domain-containing protein [Tanacetum cinerariifolium]
MQKRRNDVKVRTTLLLALPYEHQLRFSKYKTAQELWAAILKTFGRNEATKKTKKNQLKKQYGNFKAEGSETLEQTFNRLRAIVSHLEFMDVKIKQDDLNQKFLTSLALEWLMYTIVWRNRGDFDTMSLDDVYNHLKVYETEVQKKSELNSQNMAFISSAKNSSGNGEVNTASIPTASTQVSPASANVAAASISLDTACAYIASQSNDFYKAPQDDAATGSTSEGSAKKKGRTVAVTTKDMQKRRNDVKARTTLLLALPYEHQLRFSKYKTAQELWAAILKTFGRNEATKKTKKNQLKKQYGNF